MASTTTRTVELKIKLDGVQTLEELEQVTSEINDELKQIPINSKAFNEMSGLAKKANASIKEIDASLEGVTNVQKTESLFKLGEGLAGAFAVAQSASLIFGEKTSEQLEKTIAKVGGLVIALDGVKKISEAFSAENIKGLKGIVAGWKQSTIGAALFGTTTRAVLTATGIGAIVIVLGLIISNWEKVKEATINAFETLKNYVPLFYVIGKSIDYVKEKFGSIKTLIMGIGGAIKAAFQFENIADGFNNAVEASKKQIALDAQMVALNKELLTLTTDRKTEIDNQNELLAAQGGHEEDILNNKLKYNEELVKQYDEMTKVGKLTDEQVQAQKEALHNVELTRVQITKLHQDQAKAAKEKAEADKKAAEDAKKKDEDEKERIQKIKDDAVKAEQEFRKTLTDLQSQKESLIREGEIINLEISIDKDVTTEKVKDTIRSIIKSVNDEISKSKGDDVVRMGIITHITDETYKQIEGILRSIELNKIQVKNLEGQRDAKKKSNDLIDIEIDKEASRNLIGDEAKAREIKLAELDNQKLANLNEIAKIGLQINEIGKDNLKLNEDSIKVIKDAQIVSVTNNLLIEQKKILEEEWQETLYQTGALISELYNFEIAQLERKSELEKRNLQEIQDIKKGYADEDKRLNDLLADAEGKRYDDILKQIEDNDAALKQSKIDEANSIKKINEYELKAANARKTQAVIDTTIQGALSVVEALPNLVLAGIVAALTAASIATILAQPKPEPIPSPEFASGGIVPGSLYSGDRINARVNSGEMILNTEQQSNMFKMLSTATPNSSGGVGSLIDYRLIGIEVSNALKSNPMFVSVTEFNSVQNRLKVVENRSSLVG